MKELKQVDDYLSRLTGYQKKNLEAFRDLVHSASPDIEEVWKWDVPVFTFKGKMVCAMSTFKDHTKFNFFKGAALKDTKKVFNNGLESKNHRSLDLFEGDKMDETGLKDLVKQAIDIIK